MLYYRSMVGGRAVLIQFELGGNMTHLHLYPHYCRKQPVAVIRIILVRPAGAGLLFMMPGQCIGHFSQFTGIVNKPAVSAHLYHRVIPGGHGFLILVPIGGDVGVRPGKSNQHFPVFFYLLPVGIGSGKMSIDAVLTVICNKKGQWSGQGFPTVLAEQGAEIKLPYKRMYNSGVINTKAFWDVHKLELNKLSPAGGCDCYSNEPSL